jgi:hypothetical protein
MSGDFEKAIGRPADLSRLLLADQDGPVAVSPDGADEKKD